MVHGGRSHNTDAADSAALCGVVEQVSAELAEQARQLALIEQAVGALAAQVTGLDQRLVHELQHIDAVRQTIDALAAFTGALAAQLPAGWQIDPRLAAGALKLAGLADRLRGNEDKARAQPHGDLELFD